MKFTEYLRLNESDNVIPFEEMWDELLRVCHKNTAILLFGLELFSSK